MHSVQTTYKGVRYRSRLEVKWAAMFDTLGWVYEYEPFELSGYIPDFVLDFNGRQILVEVKPIVNLTDSTVPTDVVSKIKRAGWTSLDPSYDDHEPELQDTIILGAGITPLSDGDCIGVFYDRHGFPWSMGWHSCQVCVCQACKRYFPYAQHGERACTWCGDDSKHYYFKADLQDAWNQIKNSMQWRP